MRSILSTGAFIALIALASTPVAALAADGAICYSDVVSLHQPPSPGGLVHTYYPQVENSTVFHCPGGNFTFKQLSQAGWIINGISSPIHSTSINYSTGASITRTRWMITIQK